MDIKRIKKYIKANSNPNSRSNSRQVDIEFIDQDGNKFTFECLGTYGDYYNINIEIGDTISTSCTCLYKKSYPGICKHIIAALKVIIEDYSSAITKTATEEKVYELFEEIEIVDKTIKLKLNQIVLSNGIISPLIVKNWTIAPKYRGYNYNVQNIKAASQTEVITKTAGWQNFEQLFKYNPQTEIFEFECTCSKTKKVCEHIGTALEEIITVFGNNLFTKNYFEEKIQEAIAAYDFTLEDDYNSIFNFSITPRGFQAKPKVKNMIRDSKDFSKIFENDDDDTAVNLPHPIKQENDFGLGIYFEFERKKFREVTLFQAKYNKTKTDFSSSITPINTYNFEDALMIYDSSEEHRLITKSLQINKSLSKYKSTSDISYLKKAIASNLEFIQIIQDQLSYTYDSKNSLVRKNLVPCVFDNKTIKLFFTISETAYFYTLKAKVALDDKNYNLNA